MRTLSLMKKQINCSMLVGHYHHIIFFFFNIFLIFIFFIYDFLAMIYKNEQPRTASLCRGWEMLENDFNLICR